MSLISLRKARLSKAERLLRGPKLAFSGLPAGKTVLDWLELSADELTQVVRENPSLRGMIVGYVAEFQLRKVFAQCSLVSNLIKDDDHDRESKGDLRFSYKGHEFKVESKSLQTNLIYGPSTFDGSYDCTFQCDASDRRPVKFKDGSVLETTALLVGEFDILAVNLFAVAGRWEFAFARNEKLPRASSPSYTQAQREALLSTNMRVRYPVTMKDPVYRSDVFSLLDEIVAEKGSAPTLPKAKLLDEPELGVAP